MEKKIIKNIKRNFSSTEGKFKAAIAITEGITPFLEKPCSAKFTTRPADPKSQNEASDLFALFTANVIKEETLFTR